LELTNVYSNYLKQVAVELEAKMFVEDLEVPDIEGSLEILKHLEWLEKIFLRS